MNACDSCFKNGMLPIAVTKALPPTLPRKECREWQRVAECGPALHFFAQRTWWRSSGFTPRPPPLCALLGPRKVSQKIPCLVSEAKKKLSVDLQSQEIRREGGEVP